MESNSNSNDVMKQITDLLTSSNVSVEALRQYMDEQTNKALRAKRMQEASALMGRYVEDKLTLEDLTDVIRSYLKGTTTNEYYKQYLSDVIKPYVIQDVVNDLTNFLEFADTHGLFKLVDRTKSKK